MAHKLHNPAIYDGLDRLNLPVDIQGWSGDEHSRVFKQLIEETKPRIVTEVGSWKGGSVIEMAELSTAYNTHFFCCDTFLGSLEHILRPQELNKDFEWRTLHGLPLIYFTFLTNIKSRGLQDRVTPLANTSFCCANYLAYHGVLSDLIYIDGDHTVNGCYQDLCAYSQLLADKNSIIFGDDWGNYGTVIKAVKLFSRENSDKFNLDVQGRLWILRRKS